MKQKIKERIINRINKIEKEEKITKNDNLDSNDNIENNNQNENVYVTSKYRKYIQT